MMGIEKGMTKEQYIRENEALTWALLDESNEWFEKGSMGWFGCGDDDHDSRSAFDKLFWEKIKAAPDNYWLAIVDCHI